MHRQIAQFSSSPVTVSLCITRESTLLRESKGPLDLDSTGFFIIQRFGHYKARKIPSLTLSHSWKCFPQKQESGTFEAGITVPSHGLQCSVITRCAGLMGLARYSASMLPKRNSVFLSFLNLLVLPTKYKLVAFKYGVLVGFFLGLSLMFVTGSYSNFKKKMGEEVHDFSEEQKIEVVPNSLEFQGFVQHRTQLGAYDSRD
ncbi:hypothetical protein RHMOL_Rhmol08G0264800 [Rhododendron molle]|uniref:Uncharacterized protein n=1 Tax=Rhododendron molle TaxID=49168 RepID=A0ACC0MTG9_RHOML|nr:hypothetical protein RHMOL_Rhmol08G0264800 [Rhododendron molle]